MEGRCRSVRSCGGSIESGAISLIVVVIVLIMGYLSGTNCKLLSLVDEENNSLEEVWNSFKGPPQHLLRSLIRGDRAHGEHEKIIKSPLILMGGFGGSALMSRRTHAKEPHFWCSSTTEKPFQVWASIKELIPYVTEECAVHDLRLDLRGNPPMLQPMDSGVSITGKDIGGLKGVNYITDTELTDKGAYMILLTSYLIKYGGYQSGRSLRALTYDWRTGPAEWKSPRSNNTGGDWFVFKQLVEDTYEINNQTQVSLLGHSLGGPFVQLFLAIFVTPEWKQKYIKQYISVAGSYDGGVESPILHAIGDDYGFSFLSSQFKEVVRSFGALSIMYPLKFPFIQYPIFIYHNNKTGEHAEYYANLDGYKRYIADCGMVNGWNVFMHEYSEIINVKMKAPQVPLHCFIGTGIQTVTQFTYVGPKRMPDLLSSDLHKTKFENGDGTILDYSLKLCSKFEQTHPINTVLFPGARHNALMKDEKMFIKLLEIL